MRFSEEQLDNIMNNGSPLLIDNFFNSAYIENNQNEKNYCTSIRLQMPYKKEVSPIQTLGINTVPNNSNMQQGNLIPWNEFNHANIGDKIQLGVGDRIIAFESGEPNNQIGIYGVEYINNDNKTWKAVAKKAMNYAVVKVTDVGTTAAKTYITAKFGPLVGDIGGNLIGMVANKIKGYLTTSSEVGVYEFDLFGDADYSDDLNSQSEFNELGIFLPVTYFVIGN